VGDRGTILDDEDAPAADGRAIVEVNRHASAHERRPRVHQTHGAHGSIDLLARGRVHLAHHDNVGHAQDGLTRVVAGRVGGAEGVGDDDVEIRKQKREIVVPAVPDDEVGLGHRTSDDLGVVDAGEYDVARGQVRLILLALLDGAGRRVEVGQAREALHALPLEIEVGHGVANHGDPPPGAAQPGGEPAGDRRFAAPGPDGGHGDHRHAGPDHGSGRAEQAEVCARREDPRGDAHDVPVCHVAIGKDDEAHSLPRADSLQVHFILDRDA
jgi:hypothetical protein